MYESRCKPLISRQAFIQRLLSQLGFTLMLLALSLLAGMLGYHYIESMSWLDSLLNASMILGGMGPVNTLKTDAGKFFASFYALYSGIFLVICGGLLLAPVFHRILHRFHVEDE